MRGTSQPFVSSEKKASNFYRSINKSYSFRQRLLLEPQLQIEGLDLPLALSAELLQLLLHIDGQNRLTIGTCGACRQGFTCSG